MSYESKLMCWVKKILENDIWYWTLIEYNAGKPVYIWECEYWLTGDTDQEVWRIYKLEYDGSGNMIKKGAASWTTEFDKVWDDRASYIYS